MTTDATELRPAPPFLIGAALLVWGWQNNFMLYAVIMAILLEFSHWVSWRWAVTNKEFNHLTDISGAVFFIAIIYIFNETGAGGIYVILSILPFVLFVLVLTQLYSLQGKIKLSTLFLSLRRLERRQALPASRAIDLSLPYFVICLLAASAGNQRTIWFFIVCCLLFAVALWFMRPGRFRFSTWALMLLLSFSIAFAAQTGVRALQFAVERQFMGFFDQFMWRYRDPDRTTTAIGMIGRLKYSDRIQVRIKTEAKLDAPIYLREATYNTYGYGVWSAGSTNFTLIDPDIEGNSWTLNPGKPQHHAEISTYMIRETGVIPAPAGTSTLQGTDIIEVNQNRYGAINMESREGWISYKTGYQDLPLSDSPPDADDLHITSSYRDDFIRLAEELQFEGKPAAEIVHIIETFFARNFYYSIDRGRRYPRGRYLHDFLFDNRQGHCEYFATATALLLRTAGIPARYAVGYVTREYSALERQYIARSRHAHSWTMAWVNNSWQSIDTTPSVWAPMEDEMASALQPVLDLYAWIRYKYQTWRSSDALAETEESGTDLAWLLIPLLAILVWRLYAKERIRQKNNNAHTHSARTWQGMDSAFYAIVELLEKKGYERRPGETMSNWINRSAPVRQPGEMSRLLDLHYRYRFDPAGLPEREIRDIGRLARAVIMQLKAVKST
jgi:transglutaminase-like putative cysteine protease